MNKNYIIIGGLSTATFFVALIIFFILKKKSTNKYPVESPVQSTNESSDQSTNESPVQSPVQSTNESPDQSTNESPDQSTNESPDQSTNESPEQSPDKTSLSNMPIIDLPEANTASSAFEKTPGKPDWTGCGDWGDKTEACAKAFGGPKLSTSDKPVDCSLGKYGKSVAMKGKTSIKCKDAPKMPGHSENWTGCSKKLWGKTNIYACEKGLAPGKIPTGQKNDNTINGDIIDCGNPKWGNPSSATDGWFDAANYKCKDGTPMPGRSEDWTGCSKKWWGWKGQDACDAAFGKGTKLYDNKSINCGDAQYGMTESGAYQGNYKCKDPPVPPGPKQSWTGCSKEWWGWSGDGACKKAFGSNSRYAGESIDCGDSKWGKPTAWYKAGNYKCIQYKPVQSACRGKYWSGGHLWDWNSACKDMYGKSAIGDFSSGKKNVDCHKKVDGDWAWTFPCLVPK